MKTSFIYIIFTYAALICFGIIDNGRSAAFPQIIDFFKVSNFDGAQLFALASISGLLVMLSTKFWMASFGDWRAQRIFLMMMSAGSLMFGVSGLVHSYSLTLLASVVIGAAIGGVSVSVNSIIGRTGSHANRRRLFSGLHSMYGLASVMAPVLFSICDGMQIQWMYVFVFLSIAPIIVSMASLFVPNISGNAEYVTRPRGVSWKRIFIIGVLYGFGICIEVSVSSRLTQYSTSFADASPAQSALYLSMFFICLMLGRLLFAIIKLNVSSLKLMLMAVVSAGVVYLIGLFTHPAVLALVGFFISYFVPCAVDWISRRFGANGGYMLSSVLTMGSVFLILMHWLIGALTDKYGIHAALFSGPVFCVLAMILCLMLIKKYPSLPPPNKNELAEPVGV